VLYGRDAERRRLAELLDDLGRGLGQVLIIRGEAGAGKSALLREIAGDGDLRIVSARAVESEIDMAFSGLHQVLSPFLDLLDQLPEERARSLRAALGAAEGETTDLVVCTATLDLLRLAATERPLLIIVDDAHDLDTASQQVLVFCARRLAGWCRVGIVLAVRDLATACSISIGGLPELVLRGLEAEPARALLESCGWPHGAVLADAVVRATGGNPLALTELADHRSPASLLQAVITGTVPAENAVHRLFGSRVNALPPNARAALLVAAAADIGRPELILGACDRLALPRDAFEVTELAELVDGPGDEGGIVFRHPLLRSAAYLVPPAERRRVHAAIADELAVRGEQRRSRWHRALATFEPEAALAAALEADADAVERLGGVASATALLLQAARLSVRPDERARRRAMAAHSAWKSGNAALARELVSAPGHADQPAALRVRALVELFTGDQDIAFGFLRRAADLATTCDAAAELWFMAAGAGLHAGRVADAVATAELIADRHDDPAYRRYGRWLAASLDHRLDDFAAQPWEVVDAAPAAIAQSGTHRWLFPMAVTVRGRHIREAHELGVAAYGELTATGMLAMVTVPLAWLVELEFRLGRWVDATAHAGEGFRIATQLGQLPRIADFAALLAQLAAARDDELDARRHATDALQLAGASSNCLAAARATWALGSLDLARGEISQARDRLTMLATEGSMSHHPHIARLAVADVVEAHVRAGDIEAAATTADEYAHWVNPSCAPWAHCHLYRIKALLAVGAEADKAYQLALAAAEVETAPFERARIALLHGQWLRRERRITEASEPLRLAVDLFDGLGAQRWADQAAGELRACDGQRLGRVERARDLLTEQEMRVAELAAAGLSNREIGARLHLSHRTVGYHLHKIFQKLGLTRRSQLRQVAATAL
jgi:DNA-binding CsgD family transcriptional regulator